MRYRPNFYAQALKEALVGESEATHTAILKKFVALVHKNGDSFYLDRITAEFEKLEVQDQGGQVVTLEFARPASDKTIKHLSAEFSTKDLIKPKVNPRLVAGVRINIDGERELDNSIVRKLNQLFAT